jgi:hypothetical protein
MNLSEAFGVKVEALLEQWHEAVTLGELFYFASHHRQVS